ncbi:MAG: hypothetical protein KAI80_10925 [Hyphomicrobiaceae bacterium]|nr:hypothetical protein [Hyphomicrobiaceae bacterium]
MSKTNEALARRWMASKHWGGARDGMVDASPGNEGNLVYGSSIDGVPVTLWQGPGSRPMQRLSPEFLPDLDHPGTRAFLLEDVKRAFEQKWGGIRDSSFEVSHGGSRQEWRVEWRNLSNGGGWMLAQLGNGLTEAEALIAALEAAPGE